MDETDKLVAATIQFVKEQLKDAEGGHDWWHIERVWKCARRIAEEEQVNTFIVDLAALLHDIADSKFHGGDEELGPQRAGQFLRQIGVEEKVCTEVVAIIRNISFRGGHRTSDYHSPEMAVVQDADRLDAIGAIGIARAFNYGGFRNRDIYHPGWKPNPGLTKEEYKKSSAPTINHFYEKLLLLKDLMLTETGRKMATQRHEFMERYLDQFYAEWDGLR